MKKGFAAIFMLISILVFGCSNKILPQNKYIKYSIDTIYNKFQIDSICKVEKIPSVSESKWLNNSMVRSYENGNVVIQYIYIKNDSITYIVTERNKMYNFKKKIITKIK